MSEKSETEKSEARYDVSSSFRIMKIEGNKRTAMETLDDEICDMSYVGIVAFQQTVLKFLSSLGALGVAKVSAMGEEKKLAMLLAESKDEAMGLGKTRVERDGG